MRFFLQIGLIQYILFGGQNFSTWGTKFLHLGDKISPVRGQNFSTLGGRNFSVLGTKFLHLVPVKIKKTMAYNFVATVFLMDYFFFGSLISIWLSVKL